MVFYKDLNERFISENPANTVSERSGSLLSTGKMRLFLPDRLEALILPEGWSHPGRGGKPSTDDAPCSAQSCPLQPFYPGLLFKPSSPKLCTGVTCKLPLEQNRRR